jgi:N-acetylglucosaminyl-diphospho-decaprenol L-rhamnosyltransferase
MNYSVVIPVLNQLHYTKQCVDSLLAVGVPVESLLVINNGSVDETASYLAGNAHIPSINNLVNLGCGGAWTQGALAGKHEWVVLLNNDVVLGHNAIEASIAAAERLKLGVVSTSLVEGELDYDTAEFSAKFVAEMKEVVRPGWFHGVCFAVRRDVFHQIGFLDTDRNLFGREDAEFLARCKRGNIAVGTVGAAVMHHFGSITQSAMKREQGVKEFGDHRYAYRRFGMNWWDRQVNKVERKRKARSWRDAELAAHGMTLHMDRRGGSWSYR